MPNKAGGLTGQDDHTAYHRVELFMMQKGVERHKETVACMITRRMSSISFSTGSKEASGGERISSRKGRSSGHNRWHGARRIQQRSEELLTRLFERATAGWDEGDEDIEGHTHALAHSGTIERLPAQCLLRFPDGTVGFFAIPDNQPSHHADDSSSTARGKGAEQIQDHRCPTFAAVLSLSRVRLRGSKAVVYKTRYDIQATKGIAIREHAVHKDPMALYRSLAHLHWSRRILDGWSDVEAHKELQEIAGVPTGWRGARPFTGAYDPARLRFAWACNGTPRHLEPLTHPSEQATAKKGQNLCRFKSADGWPHATVRVQARF